MKRIEIHKAVIPGIVYLLFFILMGFWFFHPVKCSFERNLKETQISGFAAAEGKYLFEIEEPTVDYDDPFHLAQIRGWLIQPKGKYYGPTDADLVLASEGTAYSVHAYAEKRTDVYYMDQSDPNSKDLFVGFLARFPTEQIPTGEYRIGFLLKEAGMYSVLWTESELSVV